ncbi:MAG TPA: hypothetical protein VER76_19555, partial [Pyrinomonadaceae bacterium]|nr:hypothetical protein [Pyrinomonadaceae bacterium]
NAKSRSASAGRSGGRKRNDEVGTMNGEVKAGVRIQNTEVSRTPERVFILIPAFCVLSSPSSFLRSSFIVVSKR